MSRRGNDRRLLTRSQRSYSLLVFESAHQSNRLHQVDTFLDLPQEMRWRPICDFPSRVRFLHSPMNNAMNEMPRRCASSRSVFSSVSSRSMVVRMR